MATLLSSQRRSIDRGPQRLKHLNLRVSPSFCCLSNLQDPRPLHPFTASTANKTTEFHRIIKANQTLVIQALATFCLQTTSFVYLSTIFVFRRFLYVSVNTIKIFAYFLIVRTYRQRFLDSLLRIPKESTFSSTFIAVSRVST